MKPSVGRIVHYVSYGTPGGEYSRECRAAIVTEIPEQTKPDGPSPLASLAVLNPTGMFFKQDVPHHDGAGNPGDPGCPGPHENGPHRYCACGWTESGYPGGTWHWPERTEA